MKSEQTVHQANETNVETNFNSTASPFRRTSSLQGSRIKARRPFYNSSISEEKTKSPSETDGRSLQSFNSITSDDYYTPPSSPTTPNVSPFVNGSPATSRWADNPLYAMGKSSRTLVSRATDGVDTTPLDDALHDVLKDFESTASNFVDPSLKKASSEYFPAASGSKNAELQSLQASYRGKSDNNIEMAMTSKSSNGFTSEVSQAHLFSNSKEMEPDPSDKDGDKPGMLDYISVDAPDDTLIKPSKLRASMRSKKRSSFRGGSLPSNQDVTSTTDTSAELSSSPAISRVVMNTTAAKSNFTGSTGYTFSDSSKAAKSHGSHTGFGYKSNEPGCDYSQKYSSEINNNIKTRSIRHLRRDERSKTDEIVMPQELQSGHDGKPYLYLDQAQGANRFVFKMDSQTSDSLQVTPPETVRLDTKHRGSFRSYLKSSRSKSEPEIDDVNSVSRCCDLEHTGALLHAFCCLPASCHYC